METNVIPFFVWDEQLDAALENIANGNTSEGYIVLSHFVHDIDTGNTPDPRAQKFVIDALKEVVTTHDAGEKVDFGMIFKMKLGKKRPPLSFKGRFKRTFQYGNEITQLMLSGKNNYEAINEVASKYKRSCKNILEYWTEFNKIVEGKSVKPKKTRLKD
jgi:hypothetical protein